jgi:two-component sensor histidine kinase
MTEMQHRVKNNLQIIIAFVTTKLRHEQSPDVQEKFRNIIRRIQAVALAHDLLAVGKDNARVRFDEYLQSLCTNIDPGESRVKINVDAEPWVIPLDRAVPAGLVVNELITNSIKYAFGNEGGYIKVQFGLTTHASEACITVQDDGKGMQIPPRKGLGLSLVEAFAQQIQGRVDYVKVDTGTRTVLCFPVPS